MVFYLDACPVNILIMCYRFSVNQKMCVMNICVYISGGTRVTVYGKNLDSVAEPRITVTVLINNATNEIVSDSNTTLTPYLVRFVRYSEVRIIHTI